MHSTSRDSSMTAPAHARGATCDKILIPLRRCMQVKTNDKERVKRKRPSVRVKSTSPDFTTFIHGHQKKRGFHWLINMQAIIP